MNFHDAPYPMGELWASCCGGVLLLVLCHALSRSVYTSSGGRGMAATRIGLVGKDRIILIGGDQAEEHHRDGRFAK